MKTSDFIQLQIHQNDEINVNGGEVKMTNEDAIKWLKNLKQDNLWHYAQTIDEIIATMEEQEAVEPVKTQTAWFCGACQKRLNRIWKFCGFCGKAVKWE